MRLIPKRLRWMGLGALAAWLFDPERGRARREQIADKASATMKKTGLGGFASESNGSVTTPTPASTTSPTSVKPTSPRATTATAPTTS